MSSVTEKNGLYIVKLILTMDISRGRPKKYYGVRGFEVYLQNYLVKIPI